MSAWQPKSGSREIDRIIPPLGRIRLRTGTRDARRAAAYDRMLDVLPLEVVQLLRDRALTLREVYDRWSTGQPLPSAQDLRPLATTLEHWLDHPLKTVGPDEQGSRERVARMLRELAPVGATVGMLPRLGRKLYEQHRDAGIASSWNKRKAAMLAFARDEFGKRSTLYQDLKALPRLVETPQYAHHPCTVDEARAIAATLGSKWGPVWWAMCCTGMGPKEFWRDGWKVVADGIAIAGKKRTARNRIVPFAVRLPEPPGTMAGFAEALERADLGVTPYDARRSYERWLDEIGAPDYLQDAFMGHGPKTMRALYKWGDITAWLASMGRSCGSTSARSGRCWRSYDKQTQSSLHAPTNRVRQDL